MEDGGCKPRRAGIAVSPLSPLMAVNYSSMATWALQSTIQKIAISFYLDIGLVTDHQVLRSTPGPIFHHQRYRNIQISNKLSRMSLDSRSYMADHKDTFCRHSILQSFSLSCR